MGGMHSNNYIFFSVFTVKVLLGKKIAADCLRNLIYEYRLYVNIIISLEKLYFIEFTKTD